MRTRRFIRIWLVSSLCVLLVSARLAAQEHIDPDTASADVPETWQWHFDWNAFFGLNYQDRKFKDVTTWESQNWIMASGDRPVGNTRLALLTMFSVEPFTLEKIGSPQVFQTGEMFRGAPLIDYQHPHDLVMQLGSELRVPLGPANLTVGLDAVGTPTIGPPIFMHRLSAEPNPQTPLSHHYLDSTHVTPGVVRAGLTAGEWTFEGSWFQGREPDDDRLDIDFGALDSSAVRVNWARGAWSAQASAAWLTKPEFVTPFDSTRLTASVIYSSPRVAWMGAFGQNREIHGNLEAYMFEGSWFATRNDTFYTRVESMAKDILDIGFHPVNTFHRHRQSQVGAATFGYLRDIFHWRFGRFGVGGDITGYLVPANLEESYGSPLSVHAFVRYRFQPTVAATHVH
jgi:hypothetical protein